jgi:selenocysteine lyase/cysteine desulfurase
MNIDFLCIAPHKGLYAPMGTGILIANKNIENVLIEGGTGVNSALSVQPDIYPERMESGTLNLPGILGIGAGIDFISSKGVEKIYKSELELTKYIYAGLKKISGSVLYTPFPEYGSSVPVISFNLRGLSASKTAELLDKFNIAVRGGLHCAPFAHSTIGTLRNGTVRVSVATFNNIEEINRLLTHVKEVRRVLAAGGQVGRKLDFMMQEMNRESNTLGSKAVAIEMTNASLALKLTIEQMREQIQNLE